MNAYVWACENTLNNFGPVRPLATSGTYVTSKLQYQNGMGYNSNWASRMENIRTTNFFSLKFSVKEDARDVCIPIWLQIRTLLVINSQQKGMTRTTSRSSSDAWERGAAKSTTPRMDWISTNPLDAFGSALFSAASGNHSPKPQCLEKMYPIPEFRNTFGEHILRNAVWDFLTILPFQHFGKSLNLAKYIFTALKCHGDPILFQMGT